MVLSPTRELAMQTAKFSRQLSKFTDLRCCLLVGGQGMEQQFEAGQKERDHEKMESSILLQKERDHYIDVIHFASERKGSLYKCHPFVLGGEGNSMLMQTCMVILRDFS